MTSPHDDAPQPWTSPGSNPGTSPQPVPPSVGRPPAAPVPPAGPPVAPPVPVHPGPGGAGPQATGWGDQPAWNGQPGWGAPAPGAWRPVAAQPGIVPLRPLGLGEILDGSFRAVRANPRVMFGLSAIVVTVAVVLQYVLGWYIAPFVGGALSDIDDVDPAAGSVDLGASFGQALTTPITSLATTVLTGWLIISVSRSVIGQRVEMREVLRSRRIWLVLGYTVLAAIAVAVAVAVVVVPVVLLATSGSGGLAALVGVLGGIALLVALFVAFTRTLLVPPALMLEGRRLWPTFGRAWRLTRGSFWRLFGIYLLVSVIVSVVTQIIVTPATLLGTFAFGGPDAFGAIVIAAFASIIALTLSTTFLASVVALLYIDVRMRREGLDVELARAAGAGA
ncbi:hypothetical protein [Cellulomonas sp. HZM]|uniref:hypothetical protein n=1 Tax=Cellulomonas sp. HZM TaxID=1454010 RepID=UPI000493448D|nr:hypothetical protein [Cellulomonas sp. HZM]